MSKSIKFQYDAMDDIFYKEIEGHYYLHIPTFYSLENNANRVVEFMLDTGAFLTVVTPYTAELLGYNKLTPLKADITLTGYAGECKADLYETPGFVIGGRILEGAKIAVPKETGEAKEENIFERLCWLDPRMIWQSNGTGAAVR